MGAIFGTDGIRGIVTEELTYQMAMSCGNAIARQKKGCKILIGQDNRPSGKMLSLALALGAQLGGADVTYIGVASTPCVSYLTGKGEYDFGVVISASHNPPIYNGIKVFDASGQKLSTELENSLERLLVQPIMADNWAAGKVNFIPRLKQDYLDFLLQGCTSLKGLSILLDCGNGAGRYFATSAFKKLGANVLLTGASTNGNKINCNCGATHPQNLAKKVVSRNADFGFAFDGDADRLIVASGNGKIYNGDNILLCLTRHFVKTGKLSKPYVVGTSLSNMGLEKELTKLGIELVRADVGDKYVIAKMRTLGANLGGEQSGHIIVSDRLPTGDGILVALLLSSIVASSGKSLEELMDFTPIPQVMINVPVDDKVRAMGGEKLAKAISVVDGILGDSGRILVRPSGTEELLRIMVECDNSEQANSLANFVLSQITCKED